MPDTFSKSADFFMRYAAMQQRAEKEVPILANIFSESTQTHLLEFGCGTGHHAHALATSGFSVTATDINSEMISAASQLHAPGLTFSEEDITQPSPSLTAQAHFDGAYCLGNTLLLLPDIPSLTKAFTEVHACLVPGAFFVVHIINIKLSGKDAYRFSPLRGFPEKDGSEEILIKSFLPETDPRHPGLHLIHLKRTPQSATNIISEQITSFLAIDSDQLISFAESAGFQLTQLYGGFSTNSFNPEKHPSLLAVLRKI